MEVASKQELNTLRTELVACQQELALLRSLLTGQQWMSRKRAMAALDVCKTTLWKLTKDGALTYRKQGRKIQYDAFSIRTYLTAQNIDTWHVQERITRSALA